jgi:hypothetical protein
MRILLKKIIGQCCQTGARRTLNVEGRHRLGIYSLMRADNLEIVGEPLAGGRSAANVHPGEAEKNFQRNVSPHIQPCGCGKHEVSMPEELQIATQNNFYDVNKSWMRLRVACAKTGWDGSAGSECTDSKSVDTAELSHDILCQISSTAVYNRAHWCQSVALKAQKTQRTLTCARRALVPSGKPAEAVPTPNALGVRVRTRLDSIYA